MAILLISLLNLSDISVIGLGSTASALNLVELFNDNVKLTLYLSLRHVAVRSLRTYQFCRHGFIYTALNFVGNFISSAIIS